MKLLNGWPMEELKRDGRQVVVRQRNSIYVVYANPEFDARNCEEWAEIIKPEPKPDANGWWLFDEKKPKVGDLISCVWGDVPDFGAEGSEDGCVIRWDLRKRYANPYQWKLFLGPINER